MNSGKDTRRADSLPTDQRDGQRKTRCCRLHIHFNGLPRVCQRFMRWLYRWR